MALTELAVRSAKAEGKITKLSDGGGLQLWVTPDGAKRWRLAYRFAGGQRVLAIGVYPTVGLKEARVARQDAKRLLATGLDPSEARKQAKIEKANSAANTFEGIASELVEKKRREGKAEVTVAKAEWLLSFALPTLGARPIKEIGAPDILAVLRTVEVRGKRESAKRLRATVGQVFRYAVATGRADSDPTGALAGALASPIVKHRAAIIEPKAFGALLRSIAAYGGSPETLTALELLALTFVRPGELRSAEWSEFDHGKRPLLVPLSALPGSLHEREHNQRRPTPPRLYPGGNDCARISLDSIFDSQRVRPLEPRRHRTPTRSCRQRQCAPRLCARRLLG
jgi:integrase